MGNRDISNYPEHLNPFHEDTLAEKMKFWTLGRKKRSGSFSSSFKELKNSVRQSFRGKKDSNKHSNNDTNEVEIRNHSGSTNYRQSYTTTLPRRQESPSPALPRSRISERISLSYPQNHKNEEETRENPLETYGREGRKSHSEQEKRRRKKKAPPPPSLANLSINEELGQDYLEKPRSGSKWSITSAETDVSSNYTASEVGDDPEMSNDNINQAFKNFTNGLEKLTDDSNNNVVIEVPDIVVSCESKDKDSKADDVPKSDASGGNENNYNTKIEDEQNGNNDLRLPNNINEPRKSLQEKISYFEQQSDLKPTADLETKSEVFCIVTTENSDVESNTDAPTPKIRKNKPNKNTMLGKDSDT